MSEPVGRPVSVHGRYALHQEIASGGMARVHLGRLVGPVGFARTVAIKQLHAQFARDPDFVRMFIDEARLAGRIRHPNVVPTLDVVATEGELFLVMEYVHGESIARIVSTLDAKSERMPVQIALSIMTGVLYGLHAAHEATTEDGQPLHIIHRDVSPQNIMLGADGVARVLDFGVAKAAWRAQSTKEGQLKGKVVYMAPEQLLERGVDRRADVYSASVVLWELLVGRPLVDADNAGAAVVKVTSETPFERPSKYVTKLARGIDDAVARGLSKDPEARFATAREMAVALEKAIFIPTPREVGEWFEATMGERLKQREKLVSEVESNQKIKITIEAEAAVPTLPGKTMSTLAWGVEMPKAETAPAPAPISAPAPDSPPVIPDLELGEVPTRVAPKPKVVTPPEDALELESVPGPKPRTPSKPVVPVPVDPEVARVKAEDLELNVPVKAPKPRASAPRIVEREIPLELDQDVLRSVRPTGMRVARAVEVERVATGSARRRLPWPVVVLVLIAILVGGTVFGVPAYVKGACTSAAARAGIAMSYEDLRVGWERFTLVGVAATSADAPGARASMSDVDVELKGLEPVRIVVHNAEVTLDGPDVQPSRVTARLAGAPLVKDLVIDGGHVAWSHPLGRDLAVDADARDLKGEIVQGGAGGQAHVEALHVSLVAASGELGPWHVTYDRGPSRQQLRVDLDPEATMTLVKEGDKLTSFALDAPTLAAARLGIPPSLLGASRADAVAVSAKVRLEEKGGNQLEGRAQLAVLGLPAPGFPAPLDMALDVSGAGARGQPLDLREGSLTLGPLKASGVGGTLDVSDDGAKLSLSLHLGPTPCTAFGGASPGKRGNARGGGEFRASALLVVDTRHLADAHVTIVPLSSCSFGAPPAGK